MKRLDEAEDKKKVKHIYDSHMTCEECGETRHLGNCCPKVHEDVNNNNNYYCPQQNQGWNQQQRPNHTQVIIKVTILTTILIYHL